MTDNIFTASKAPLYKLFQNNGIEKLGCYGWERTNWWPAAEAPLILANCNRIVVNMNQKTIFPNVESITDPNERVWTAVDSVVTWAQANDMAIGALHQSYPVAPHYPSWFADESEGTPIYDSDDVKGFLQTMIEVQAERYAGVIDVWSCSNESVVAAHNGGDFYMSKITGTYTNQAVTDNYRKLVYDWHKAVDPDAILIFNEATQWHLEAGYYTDLANEFDTMLHNHAAAGTPLDGVGLQFHLHEGVDQSNLPDYDDIKDQLERYSGILDEHFGIPAPNIYVTEMDYSLEAGQSDRQSLDGWETMVNAIVDSQCVKEVWLFTIAENQNWRSANNDGNICLFDGSHNHKAEYRTVYKALATNNRLVRKRITRTE